MKHPHRTYTARVLVGAAALTLSTLAWTAGDHAGGHANGGHGHGHSQDHGHDFSFGKAAPAAKADRTVEIVASDQMDFSPDALQVQAGQTVRFVVKNVGDLPHSFTLGTPSRQAKHEQSMQGMSAEKMAGHMKDAPHGMVLQPGETQSLTWRFSDGGPIEFACHIQGHYPAGMKGQIRIH